MATFPVLYAVASNGKVKQWEINVTSGPPPAIVITHGYKDGKQTTSERQVRTGKNIGKANETSALQQAILEAQSKFNSKVDEGYTENSDATPILLPMLAMDFTKRGKDIMFPCFVQPKLDGVRCLFSNGNMTSRTGKPFHLLHILSELKDVDIILDGELYADTDFQDIVSLVRRQTFTEETRKISFFVYDIVSDQPFSERIVKLRHFFRDRHFRHIKPVVTEICDRPDRVREFHDKYVREGYEGLMLRNAAGPYQINTRSKHLQKYKQFVDDEYKIIGFSQGEGIERGLVLWECETSDGKRFHVRPRGSHEQRAALFANAQKYVGKMLTVRYQELTLDGIPRFPVGIDIRDYE